MLCGLHRKRMKDGRNIPLLFLDFDFLSSIFRWCLRAFTHERVSIGCKVRPCALLLRAVFLRHLLFRSQLTEMQLAGRYMLPMKASLAKCSQERLSGRGEFTRDVSQARFARTPAATLGRVGGYLSGSVRLCADFCCTPPSLFT